jgi:hypothetical protein
MLAMQKRISVLTAKKKIEEPKPVIGSRGSSFRLVMGLFS